MIYIKNVSKKYKNTTILENINLDISKNQLVVFVGNNGCGKSTLLKIISGTIRPDEGTVLIDNTQMNNKNFNKLMRKFGVVLEGSRNLYWRLTVLDNIKYFGALKGMTSKQIYDRVERLEKLDWLTIKDLQNKPVRMLSLGQKQRVAIFISLLHNPEILILDEPFNGIDIQTKEQLSQLLVHLRDAEGMTILLTSHIDNTLNDLADKKVMIENKKIIIIEKDTYNNFERSS